MNPNHLEVALQAFGDELVAFCLNVEPPFSEANSNADRIAALEELAKLAEFGISRPQDIHSLAWRANLAREDAEGMIYRLRKLCGGEVQRPSSEDETELRLLECIYETYPTILLPPPPDDYPLYPDLLGLESDAFELLVEALLGDDDLKRLFLDPNETIPTSRQTHKERSRIFADHYWTAGNGGTNFVGIAAVNLIQHAFRLAALYDDRSLNACLQHGREGLRIARILARGEKVNIPHLSSYSSLRLQQGIARVPLGSGELRSLSSRGQACMRMFGANGDQPEVAVFSEIEEQLASLNFRTGDEDADKAILDKRWSNYAPKFQTSLDKRKKERSIFRYSLLLAMSPQVATGTPQGDTVLNPLTIPAVWPIGGEDSSAAPAIEITTEIATSVTEWSTRVINQHPTSLDIGMRRLLSAATARSDDMDGFVDAVMCWENIFGDSQDTALKVCGSLARLLEPDDDEKRRKLYERLKKMYDLRSRLVHGSDEPDLATANLNRTEAVSIAVAAMRAMYQSPPLLEAKNSVERWKFVLIGPASPKTRSS
ncbi:HEPN domain-containing protein [Micromonospora sp. S-DT3-3-22]|uniref:HEPN domain-containing protein n=1 Tax=Micromonospora sp. S-DT3-3-22 TaxID=2755359 RepID=UPI00188F82E6|nr:HEPN domain-containing protein [Micromonospora sp. S-DT3-3-22]